jgi:hypothetical protein
MVNKFNYVIGQYWNGVDGAIGAYTYFSETHYGTRADAEQMLKYVQGKESSGNSVYKIFYLVELSDETSFNQHIMETISG